MASLTNSFLTNGPASGDPGDITAGSAYHVVWAQIGRAIADAAEKHDENSKKIVDELKNLREHFKQEAEKSPNKRISELPPEVAREFLEVSRLIKDIKSAASRSNSLPPTSVSNRHGYHHGHHHGVVNSAFEGRGPIVRADALTPGTGVVVKAVQENSHLIRDTFHAFGHAASLFRDSFKMFTSTFKAIHNFLDPNHPSSLVNALSKLLGRKGGGGGILGGITSFLKSRVIGSAIGIVLRRILPMLIGAIGASFTTIAGLGLAAVLGYFAKRYYDEQMDKTKDWPTLFGDKEFGLRLDPEKWGWLFSLLGKNTKPGGGSTRSFLNPEGGVVPGGQGTQPFNLNTRSIKAPQSFNEGFNFNTGIASDESDTIIQLMMKQTQLLGEILKALLSGGGQGYVRGLQSGGTAAPGEPVLVGENGPENIQVGGRSGTVNGPMLLQAGSSPVQVNPADSKGSIGPQLPSPAYAAQLASQQSFVGPSLPHSQSFVSPIGNPNVNQAVLKTNEQGLLPAALRSNNPGAISGSAATAERYHGYLGEYRSPGEASLKAKDKLNDPSNYYLKFDTPEEGIRAQAQVLLSNYAAKGKDTIHDIIYGGYADRGQAAYVADVSKRMGIGPNDKLDLANNPANLAAYLRASQTHEVGAKGLPYTPETYDRALTGADMEHWSTRNPESPDPKLHPGYERGGPKGYRVKADPAQQNATLPVKGGGPTADDTHRNVSALKAKERQLKSGRDTKQPAPQQPHQGRAPPNKQSSHKAIFSNVGMVTLTSNSGFG